MKEVYTQASGMTRECADFIRYLALSNKTSRAAALSNVVKKSMKEYEEEHGKINFADEAARLEFEKKLATDERLAQREQASIRALNAKKEKEKERRERIKQAKEKKEKSTPEEDPKKREAEQERKKKEAEQERKKREAEQPKEEGRKKRRERKKHVLTKDEIFKLLVKLDTEKKCKVDAAIEQTLRDIKEKEDINEWTGEW